MSEKLKPGVCVLVEDFGLAALRGIMGSDAPPNHVGIISTDPWDDEDTYLIEFPIGDDPISEHSQVAPFPKHQVREVSQSDPLYKYWEKK